MQIIRYILAWGIFLLPLAARAQSSAYDTGPEVVQTDIESRMLDYVDELSQLAFVCDMQMRFPEGMPVSLSYVEILKDKVTVINENYQMIDVRWSTFTQALQQDIADDEDLMTLMAKVQQLKISVRDSIALKQQQCDALADFVNAEQLIQGKDTVYANLYKKAFKLSLLQKLEPQLEKLKAREQTLFTQLQDNYAKAQQAREMVPVLAKRMEALDDRFYNIQVMSKKIQEMAYKPFIQRIKDYLIGLACVAVLLLFANFFVSKIKAAKTARSQMKKYEEMMRKNGGENDYPTI